MFDESSSRELGGTGMRSGLGLKRSYPGIVRAMEAASGTTDQEYDDNGVDRTLVRATLALSPAERARSHDALLADVIELARAGERARARDARST